MSKSVGPRASDGSGLFRLDRRQFALTGLGAGCSAALNAAAARAASDLATQASIAPSLTPVSVGHLLDQWTQTRRDIDGVVTHHQIFGSWCIAIQTASIPVPAWATAGQLPGETWLEFVALAGESPELALSVESRKRLVFFDEALTDTALPLCRLAIGCARCDLDEAMEGISALINRPQMIGIDMGDIFEAASVGTWLNEFRGEPPRDDFEPGEGRMLALPGLGFGVQTGLRALNRAYDDLAAMGFGGGVFVNWLLDVADGNGTTLTKFDALLTGALEGRPLRNCVATITVRPGRDRLLLYAFR